MTDIITKTSVATGEKYFLIKHKSGLDIYVLPKKLAVSNVFFTTRYGSVDNEFKLDTDKEFTKVPDGIAHFLEHKMFENEDGTDTFERFAKYGASANAFTSNEITSYLFSCTDNFYENLEILMDYVTKPYFTKETVAKEQGIIGQEIRMCEDDPGRALYDNLLKAMYKDNQINVNIAGTVESIAEITAELLYKCYYTFYNLANMFMVVSGDVEVEKIVKIADKMLKCEPPKNIIRRYGKENAAVNIPRIEASFAVSKPTFMIGVKDINISEDPKERMKRNIRGDMLYTLLFGRTSPFAIDVYESGLINGFGSSYEITKNHAYGMIMGETNDVDAVFDKFKKYIADVKKSGLKKEDFERNKRVGYASLIRMFDSTDAIVQNFTYMMSDGIDFFDYTDEYANLKFEDVENLLDEMFRDEYYSLSVIKPIKK